MSAAAVPSQLDKANAFRALHQRPELFLIPNPWDAGTARLLEHLGFSALATTSAGCAFALARRDGEIGRQRILENAAAIAAATRLPVSADLENGFGDSPDDAAQTIRAAAAAGVVGGSIEDSTGHPEAPIYELSHAVERVRAAAEAARSLSFPFTLTARCENYLLGRPDLDDTLRRLAAYEEAGADVLYAPGLSARDEIAAVVGALHRPINVLMGIRGSKLTVPELAALGVRRVSMGGALSRLAFAAVLRAAREMRERGTFTFVDEALPSGELSALFAP